MLSRMLSPLLFDYIVCVLAGTSFVIHLHGFKKSYLLTNKKGFITRILIIIVSILKILLEIDWILNMGYDIIGPVNFFWCLSDIIIFTIFIYTYIVYRNA